MHESTLFIETSVRPILCTRVESITDLRVWFQQHGFHSIFAYNALLDRNHFPELQDYDWYDIMCLAAYHPKIPSSADCCFTGHLKRSLGVEPMLRLLSRDSTYHERHNAFFDTLDELEIVHLLKQQLTEYIPMPCHKEGCIRFD